MLQEYHRQTSSKSFGPFLKGKSEKKNSFFFIVTLIRFSTDRSQRRWNFDSKAPWNLSLLSVSKSSTSSDDDVEQFDIEKKSTTTSRRSSWISSLESNDFLQKTQLDFDPYILHKHLFAITSTQSNLVATDVDPRTRELFDESRSSFRMENDEFHPRMIRPPPFTDHLEKIRQSFIETNNKQRRSARLSVRTNRAESLRLERLKSASEIREKPMKTRPLTSLPQRSDRSTFRPAIRNSAVPFVTRSFAASESSYRQSESTRSCKLALGIDRPLHLSRFLVKQMRQDISSNRGESTKKELSNSKMKSFVLFCLFEIVPAYSKPLSSALLREQPNPIVNRQLKMNRVREWLDQIPTNDFFEFNEFASKETIAPTEWNEKLDDDIDLLNDEKQKKNVERTTSEAHRVLPLFRTEIERKKRQHDLLLTRIELDLFVF